MKTRPQTKYNLKYKILVPNHSIVSFKRAFLLNNHNCPYEMAVKDNMAIRRYKTQSCSFEKLIEDCQWRFLAKEPIVKCLYAELLSPNMSAKRIEINIYTQHIQLPLSKMKKLLLSEAFFIIKQAVRAFEVLLQRYSEVTVNEQTIGLDIKGQTLVWINQNLNQSSCDQRTSKKIVFQVIKELFQLVSFRCQQKSSKLLMHFYQHQLASPGLTFQELHKKIRHFMNINKIVVPQNLKYLVNQNKIITNLEELKLQKELMENKNALNVLKTPRFSCNFLSKRTIRQEQSIFYSPKQNYKKQRTTLQNILPCKFNHKTQNKPSIQNIYTHNKITSTVTISQKESIQKDDYSIVVSPFHDSKNSFLMISEKSSNKDKRYKTQSSRDCIRIINNLKNNQLSQTTLSFQNKEVLQRNDRQRENALNNDIFDHIQIKKSNFSIKEGHKGQQIERKSFNEAPQVKTLSVWPNSIARNKKISITLQCAIESEHPTFQMLPQQDKVLEIYEYNHWNYKFKSLLQTQSKLNTSITQGPQVSNYLSHIRLQKLDTLSRQLTQSIIPMDQFPNLSIRSIDFQEKI